MTKMYGERPDRSDELGDLAESIRALKNNDGSIDANVAYEELALEVDAQQAAEKQKETYRFGKKLKEA